MTSGRTKTKAGVDEEQERKNRIKTRVRARVEWSFRVLKRVFASVKVRYRGLIQMGDPGTAGGYLL